MSSHFCFFSIECVYNDSVCAHQGTVKTEQESSQTKLWEIAFHRINSIRKNDK